MSRRNSRSWIPVRIGDVDAHSRTGVLYGLIPDDYHQRDEPGTISALIRLLSARLKGKPGDGYIK